MKWFTGVCQSGITESKRLALYFTKTRARLTKFHSRAQKKRTSRILTPVETCRSLSTSLTLTIAPNPVFLAGVKKIDDLIYERRAAAWFIRITEKGREYCFSWPVERQRKTNNAVEEIYRIFLEFLSGNFSTFLEALASLQNLDNFTNFRDRCQRLHEFEALECFIKLYYLSAFIFSTFE